MIPPRDDTVPTTAAVYLLGGAGLLPFLAGAVLIWFDEPVNPVFVLQAFNIYSLMLLSFLGGAWWGFSFAGMDARPRLLLRLGAVAVLLCLWLLMLFAPGRQILAALGAAYLVLLLPELGSRSLPVDVTYRRLRIVFTGVAVACHLSVFVCVSGMLGTRF